MDDDNAVDKTVVELAPASPLVDQVSGSNGKSSLTPNRQEEEGVVAQDDNVDAHINANFNTTNDSGNNSANITAQLDGTATTDNNSSTKKESKNQLKRKQKWERAMEVKRRRKQQERDVKIAKAKAEGRDMEAEKNDVEKRRQEGAGWARRNELWQEIFQKQSSSYQICLDCSFESRMMAKEVNSLALQIRYCYATNKKAKHPVKVTVTNLGGETIQHLRNVSGFDQWMHRAFHYTEKSLEEAYPDKSKLVYLTSDSENVLSDLEDDKVYVIGGIVDRNRLKRAAIDRAESLGIATAKLPITDYLDMVTTKVLTCNHVFDILLKYRECGKDWKKAFLDVLPSRKDVTAKENEEN